MNRRFCRSSHARRGCRMYAGLAKPVAAAPSLGRTNVRFLGMMTFVERTDRSFLVATPGQHGLHHMTHVPFLMARAGSPIAKALGMLPAPGVVPAAFDTQLIGTNPGEFVYRNLDNTSIEIVAGRAVRSTTPRNRWRCCRHCTGKRVRGNIEKWASTSISLRGGRLDDSAAILTPAGVDVRQLQTAPHRRGELQQPRRHVDQGDERRRRSIVHHVRRTGCRSVGDLGGDT